MVLSHREGASPAAPHASRSQTRKLGWNLFRGTSGMGRGHRGSLTPQDLLLPEGKLIRTTRGGPSALKQLLLDLKKYSFSGYVRTVRSGAGKRAEGIVLLRGGNPEASLYHRDGTQDRGRSALKKVWQDSYDESCVLELHARVDMDGLVREYADAILERPAKVVKKTKIPQTMERSEIERQIRSWKDRGYDVSSVDSNLDAEPSILAASVVAMRDGVKKAEAVGEILAGLDVSGFESRAAILREKLKDPVRHPDIDTEVESLRDAVESLRQIDARREAEMERGRDSQARTRKVLDLVMKQQQALRPEGGPYSTEDIARKVLEESMPARDAATNLVQTYTFESFIVGESNRFAHGAAVAVAKQPAKEYNPLLITSGPGLGKTHLLHAIGNYIVAHANESKVLYLTCEAFASSLANAKEVGTLSAFRDRIRGMDCLMIDDIQFLSGMPEIHEELFHTFNDLHDKEKQLVLASDRPPKAIPNLDDRLVSRFESGLVAGIEPPDLLMRVTILEHRARDENVSIEGVPTLDGFPRWRGRRPGHQSDEPETGPAGARPSDGARPVAHGPRGVGGRDDRADPGADRLRDRGLHGEAAPRRDPPGRDRVPRLEQLVRRRPHVRPAAPRRNLREPVRVHHLPRACDPERPGAQGARTGDGSDPLSVIASGLTETLNGLVEFADLPERVAPRLPLHVGARFFEDADGSREVAAAHLQVQQFVPRLPHLVLDERRHVPLHPFLRLLPEPEGACHIPPVERLPPLPEEPLRVAEVHAHRPDLAHGPIAIVDDLARLMEVFRLRVERPERPLDPVPRGVVVARLHSADGLLELRRGRLDARVPFGGS